MGFRSPTPFDIIRFLFFRRRWTFDVVRKCFNIFIPQYTAVSGYACSLKDSSSCEEAEKERDAITSFFQKAAKLTIGCCYTDYCNAENMASSFKQSCTIITILLVFILHWCSFIHKWDIFDMRDSVSNSNSVDWRHPELKFNKPANIMDFL